MKTKYSFVLRKIAEDYILVPSGEAENNFGRILSITEAAARIWELIPEAEDEEYIIDKITEEYDVSREEAASDIKIFFIKLRNLNIID